MDLALIQTLAALIGAISSVILAVIMYRKVNSVQDETFGLVHDLWDNLKAFYIQEKTDLIENAPSLIASALHKPIMSQLGKASGVSRQLKALEGDLIADGVGAAVGNPELGALAAKYIQKYPVLKNLLPMLGGMRRPPNPVQPQRPNDGWGVM